MPKALEEGEKMKLLAIDGNSLINRAFYGIKLLSTKDGKYTNAVYGFINILFKLIDSEHPDGVAVAFDIKKPTFRHEKYDAYKAGRHAMPDELREQFPLVKEWLTLAGYHCIECEGFEADDILGTLAAEAVKSGNECVVATGDRDSLQLVSENTRVLLATTRMGQTEVIDYTPEKVLERYGVTPKEMIELKALMGDSSDNIPGVAGIGEKTATDLISRFHSIDYIYDNILTIDIKDGVRKKLVTDRESAFLSRWLGTICLEAPIEADFEKYGLGEGQHKAYFTLTTTKDEVYTVYIGDRTLAGDGYYVRYPGRNAIYVLDNTIKRDLLASAEYLVNTMLVYPADINAYVLVTIKAFSVIPGRKHGGKLGFG